MASFEPKAVNTLKKGSSVIIDGEPCKILDTTSSKSGKHGHAKFRIEAVGLFDEKKRQIVVPSGGNLDCPIVEKRTAQVLSVSGNIASLMDAESFENIELPIPEDLKDQIKEGIEILYWEVLDRKVIKSVKGGAE